MRKLRTQMRWIMILIAAAFLLSTFLMYDRGSSRQGSSSSGRMEDYAVADINGRRLMRSALEQRMQSALQELAPNDAASVDLPHLYQAVLNQYALEIQLDQEVKNSGISISDAEAEQAMKEIADRTFPTREAFYQWLERSGNRAADYKKEIARDMANRQLIQSAVGDVSVSEDEALSFYDSMKTLFFRQPSGFMIHLASFATKDGAEKTRALLLAGEAWDRATSGDAVASADLRNATKEPVFVPDSVFDDRFSAMKDLEIDAVSPVFEVMSDDFSVGVRTERIEEKITSYEEVSGDIRSLLLQQKQSQAMENFTQSLLEKARIVIHDHSLFPSEDPVLPVTGPVADVSGDAVSEDVASDVTSNVSDVVSEDKDAVSENLASDEATRNLPLSEDAQSFLETEVVSR